MRTTYVSNSCLFILRFCQMPPCDKYRMAEIYPCKNKTVSLHLYYYKFPNNITRILTKLEWSTCKMNQVHWYILGFYNLKHNELKWRSSPSHIDITLGLHKIKHLNTCKDVPLSHMHVFICQCLNIMPLSLKALYPLPPNVSTSCVMEQSEPDIKRCLPDIKRLLYHVKLTFSFKNVQNLLKSSYLQSQVWMYF